MGLDFCWFWRWVAAPMGPTKPISESYCHLKLRRPPLLLQPISPPCSLQLAANLSQSSCGCEIWDGANGFEICGCGQWCGAVDLVAILVKYYFNVWIYYFNV